MPNDGTVVGSTKITGPPPPPVPLSVTVTRPVTGSFDGMVRVPFFAPGLVGLNLTATMHVCCAASVAPLHGSDVFLN